jgi:hypothetical protein
MLWESPDCIERWADSDNHSEYFILSEPDPSDVVHVAPAGTYYWAVVPVCDDQEKGTWSVVEEIGTWSP